MVKITALKILPDYKLNLSFSDGFRLIFDVKPYIGNDEMTSKLKDENYFSQVKIYENGRGIYWPNEFDFCPDFLRFHTGEKANVA